MRDAVRDGGRPSIAEIVRAIGADSGPMTIGDVADEAGEPIAVLPTIFHQR